MLLGSVRQFLKGGLTPNHVRISVTLAFVLGFIPDYQSSIGFVALLLLLASVVRINAGLFALSFIVAKTLFLLALPWNFELGHWVLHSQWGGVFVGLSRLPVLAWFGFEHYALIGSMIVALPLAAIASVMATIAIGRLRVTSAQLQESHYFARFSNSLMGRAFLGLLLGGAAKEGLSVALGKEVSLFRWKQSAILLLLIGALGLGFWQWFKVGLKDTLVPVLERAHGATVDVRELSLDLFVGRLEVNGLAVTDPTNLESNLFVAEQLHIDLSTTALLSKRIDITEVRALGAASGSVRAVPGQSVGPLVAPVEVTAPSPSPDDIGAYVKEAKVWLERLRQVQDWLQRWADTESEPPSSAPKPLSPDYEDWLNQQIQQSGYAQVAYAPIEAGYWPVVAHKVYVEPLHLASLGAVGFSLEASDLASRPTQHGTAPSFRLRSDDALVMADMTLNELTQVGLNTLEIRLTELKAESALASLKPSLSERVNGGLIDLDLSGEFSFSDDGVLDLTLDSVLTGSSLEIKGRSVPVETFTVKVGLAGTMQAPKVQVDQKQLESQLKDLAEGALKTETQRRVEEKLKDKVGDRLKGLFQ
jgi:uncharacterized protein (TIGR03546 family)